MLTMGTRYCRFQSDTSSVPSNAKPVLNDIIGHKTEQIANGPNIKTLLRFAVELAIESVNNSSLVRLHHSLVILAATLCGSKYPLYCAIFHFTRKHVLVHSEKPLLLDRTFFTGMSSMMYATKFSPSSSPWGKL